MWQDKQAGHEKSSELAIYAYIYHWGSEEGEQSRLSADVMAEVPTATVMMCMYYANEGHAHLERFSRYREDTGRGRTRSGGLKIRLWDKWWVKNAHARIPSHAVIMRCIASLTTRYFARSPR